ncbi:hypothetical protein PJL18_02354 [Paenarthrobacter nicotinovorans]|nr:hypothetical protein [Paenarthrobacter nicotinovorans]
MVSWMSMACAMATLVPTPSVDVASSGFLKVSSLETSYRPAKPPTPPITDELWVALTASFMSSTARSPASTSTPAEA